MRTEINGDKLKLVKQDLEAWGDRCLFRIEPQDMPTEGEAFVMQRLNYSTQPFTIKRMPDGSGQVELFYSRGD